MLVYLLKVTIIWGVFLLLFESLYKRGKWFNANRFFLVLALLIGITLPLIPWDFPKPVARVTVINSWNVWNDIPNPVGASSKVSIQSTDWRTILFGVYGGGLLILLIINTREILGIIRSTVYGNYTIWNGHKVFSGNKPHAPYSFMGCIFIYRPEEYMASEREYLLRHEWAHVRNKHWLDLLVLQLFCILFWFHPLVWRYRHLLKLTHEYQADDFAAEENQYEYGHFLLEQTLLARAPSVAHSFYFSSLKNRLKMLTQTKTRMRSGWKYAAVIPALFGCTFLMAQDHQSDTRVKKGNITLYRGNNFEWGKETIDSIMVVDPLSGGSIYQTSRHSPGIVKVNQEKVFPESEVGIPAQYRADNIDFSDYLTQELKSRSELIPGNITRIQIRDLVINQKGKMIYYDIMYLGTNMSGLDIPVFSGNPALDPVVEEIIDRCGDWNPALKDGKAVNVFIDKAISVDLKPLHFKARPLKRKDSVLKE